MLGFTSKTGQKNNNIWLVWLGVLLGVVLLLVITVWYWKLNKEHFTATTSTITTTTTTKLRANYPFIWRIDKSGDLNDKNNSERHLAILYKDITGADGSLTQKQTPINNGNIITDKTTTKFQDIDLDFKGHIVGLNTNSIENTTEHLQLLPSTNLSSIWEDYKFLGKMLVSLGFTICMWVRFPSIRTAISNDGFQISNQSECLIEIFKLGAENGPSNTTNGGYFTISRAMSNNGTNNNKISCGFADPKLRITSTTVFDKDTWNHIAVSYINGKINLFINGILEGTLTISSSDNINVIKMDQTSVINIGKNSRSLNDLNAKNCNSCSYAKFYMADLQFYSVALNIEAFIKNICMFSDTSKKLITPYNWKVGKINSLPPKTAFIDNNNTPYNFKIDGINNPISSDTINKQIKFDEANGLVNITNNYLQFLPQRYAITGTKTTYDNPDAFKNYEFMKTGFTMEIKCKFASVDSVGQTNNYAPFNGQSEYIMEFFKQGAQINIRGTGGYLFIARRPRDSNGNVIKDYTNHISIGVLGKELRTVSPITDFNKIHSFKIIFIPKTVSQPDNRLYFFVNDTPQKQFIDDKINKNRVDYLTLIDAELPIIDTTTKFNVGYGSREKDKTTGLSIESVYLSDSTDLNPITTTAGATSTTVRQTSTTAGATSTTVRQTSTTAIATSTTVGQTSTTVGITTPEFKWKVEIKNGTNIMGAGNNIMNNQIVAMKDVQPSNTAQQTNLDVYNGDIVGINIKPNTTKEYLHFLPNTTPKLESDGSPGGIIGFNDYLFLTPPSTNGNGQGFTIAMTVKFKFSENSKSETLFEFFNSSDNANPPKYFYINRLASSAGGDKNKIVAGYSNYNGYAKSILPIADNLWNHIAITCVNNSNKENQIVVYLNGVPGAVVDFDYPRCVFSITDSTQINIGKKSFTSNLYNDSINTTPPNSYSSILLADVQLYGSKLTADKIKELATTSITNLPAEVREPIWNPNMFSFATVPIQLS